MRRARRLAACLAAASASRGGGRPAARRTLGYWDNWTDAAGVSHLTRCALRRFALESRFAGRRRRNGVTGRRRPRGRCSDPRRAAGLGRRMAREPDGAVDHPPAGHWFLQATDGSSITAKPGDIVIGEDQGAKPDGAGHAGHLSRNDGPVAVSLLIVQMAGLPSAKRPCRFQ